MNAFKALFINHVQSITPHVLSEGFFSGCNFTNKIGIKLRPKFFLEGSEGTVKILGNNKIQVPVIGVLRTYERLPQVLTKSATISRQADRWFISFRFEVDQQDLTNADVVGVDLGVKALCTLSTGEVVIGAKSYKKYEAKLSRMQWLHRRKVKGSANSKKAQMQVARLHRKIANIRKDTLHKLTTLLAKNHGTVAIEDLNVSGMMANHKLAKAIADMSFFEFSAYRNYLFGFPTPLYGNMY